MKRLYTTKEAAEYLTISNDLLRSSRTKGILCGRAAPVYLRMGPGAIRYDLSVLDEWLSKGENRTKTKEERD